MINFNGFSENGPISPIPVLFFTDSRPELENRLADLDENTEKEVRKHLGEFHSAEEMEIFINNLRKGDTSTT